MERLITEDVTLPAGFDALKKQFVITPQYNSASRRVEFLVEGDGINEALQEIYQNAPVRVLDFIRALKTYRSAIYSLSRGVR